ncbi:MAG: hypothetical protein IPL79_07590 [Myxococcales bacterium]|nr:hypothetical protein [Myxococcales bacterium]
MALVGEFATFSLEDLIDWATRRGVVASVRFRCLDPIRLPTTFGRAGTAGEQYDQGSLIDDRELTLFLSHGMLVGAGSSSPQEQLGGILAASGLLGDEAKFHAEEMQQQSTLGLGKILELSHAVPEATIVEVVSTKMFETVSELLSWQNAAFTVTRVQAHHVGVPVELPLDDVWRFALEKSDSWRRLRALVPHDELRFFAPGAAPPAILGNADLHDIWVNAVGGRSAGELAARRLGQKTAVYTRLADLLEAGHLQYDKRRTPRSDSAAEFASGALSRLRLGMLDDAVKLLQRARALDPKDAIVVQAEQALERAGHMVAALDIMRTIRIPVQSGAAPSGLSDAEDRMYRRIDGVWDVMSLVRNSQLREGDAVAALAKLIHRGFVAWKTPSPGQTPSPLEADLGTDLQAPAQ